MLEWKSRCCAQTRKYRPLEQTIVVLKRNIDLFTTANQTNSCVWNSQVRCSSLFSTCSRVESGSVPRYICEGLSSQGGGLTKKRKKLLKTLCNICLHVDMLTTPASCHSGNSVNWIHMLDNIYSLIFLNSLIWRSLFWLLSSHYCLTS